MLGGWTWPWKQVLRLPHERAAVIPDLGLLRNELGAPHAHQCIHRARWGLCPRQTGCGVQGWPSVLILKLSQPGLLHSTSLRHSGPAGFPADPFSPGQVTQAVTVGFCVQAGSVLSAGLTWGSGKGTARVCPRSCLVPPLLAPDTLKTSHSRACFPHPKTRQPSVSPELQARSLEPQPEVALPHGKACLVHCWSGGSHSTPSTAATPPRASW